MKIMICGALQKEIGNFGDDLLREILINNLHSYYDNVDITDYSSEIKLKTIKEMDLFIYIPGGYMGYIEKWYSGSLKKSMQRLIHYYWPGIKAIICRKPVIMLAQGIGPYEYPVLAPFLRFIAKRSILITVRDKKSKALLRRIGVKNKKIYVTADTAQTLKKYNFIGETKESKKIKEDFRGKKIIFIHYVYGNEYLVQIYNACKELFFDNSNICFVIGGDGKSDFRAIMHYANKFPKGRHYAYDYKNVKQLINIIDCVDCVITGKFHVGIVGCTLSKSVLNFSVQYDKASLYYQQIGYPERCIDFFSTDTKSIKENIEKYWNEKVVLNEDILRKAQSNYDVYLKKCLKV